MSGSQFLSQVKELYPDTVRIIISGYADFQAVSDAINQGAIYKFLAKPWNNEMLRREIREAFTIQSLRQRNNQFSYLFDSTIEAIMMSDEQGLIESINPAFSELTGFSKQQVIGKHFNTFLLTSSQDPISDSVLLSNPSSEWHGELRCLKSDEQQFPIWLSFMKIKGPYNETIYAALFIDISDQKQNEARIEFQAYHDELTGLPNRRLFNDHLELALHQSKRHQNKIAVLFIDLDRFKHVNDTLGHEVGDQLLMAVSQRLNSTIRRGETLARFGGDEFVVILPSLNGLQECETVANKIIHILAEPFNIAGEKLHISPSIGISTFITGGDNEHLLMRHADSAMYRAKALGGNNFQFYDAASNQEIKNLLQVESALHEAIEHHEFVIHYQPQANPHNGIICHAEALVRWQHPSEGLLYPAQFIDVAQKTGLILPIGKNILQLSCAQLAQWHHEDGLAITLAVNLSACQFNDPHLLDDVCQLIDEHQLDPQWLELEVTESILLNDIASSTATLNRLADMGVRIALDDFGTGYSSLSYLKTLPISTLKIDRSFIEGLPHNQQDSIITGFIIDLAKGLGLSIVAEGIENKQQYDFLCEAGCDLIQGYYVSPPVNHQDFKALISP